MPSGKWRPFCLNLNVLNNINVLNWEVQLTEENPLNQFFLLRGTGGVDFPLPIAFKDKAS